MLSNLLNNSTQEQEMLTNSQSNMSQTVIIKSTINRQIKKFQLKNHYMMSYCCYTSIKHNWLSKASTCRNTNRCHIHFHYVEIESITSNFVNTNITLTSCNQCQHVKSWEYVSLQSSLTNSTCLCIISNRTSKPHDVTSS